MDICTIWHPRYGVIYDELEEIRRGKNRQKERSLWRKAMEEPFGPPRRITITVVQYVELSFGQRGNH